MGWVVIQYKNSKILGISVCRRPIPASRNAVLSVCHHHKEACFLIKIDDDVDIRGLIKQVLFTNPGERLNQPGFGVGLQQYVFAPNTPESRAVIKNSVKLKGTEGLKIDQFSMTASDQKQTFRYCYKNEIHNLLEPTPSREGSSSLPNLITEQTPGRSPRHDAQEQVVS